MTGLEPVLLGSAATAATATTAATAATTGLFGAGGTFALGQTLTTVGALAGIGGAVASAKGEQQAALYNSAQARLEAAAEENRRRREGKTELGRIRAAISKSGVTAEGSALLALAESAAQVELDAQNARWGGQVQSGYYQTQAAAATRALPFTVGSSLLTAGSQIGRAV